MLSVDDALDAILSDVKALDAETVELTDLPGRVAAEDIVARSTQPPFAASAMDGYAVRHKDAKKGAALTVVGEAPAGSPFDGSVGAGEAVRIFTGGAVPRGADHVVIQEETAREGETVTIEADQPAPSNVRRAGVDFRARDKLVAAGTMLHAVHPSVVAAANVDEAEVVRRPRFALFSNGDELRTPGDKLKPGEIVNANHYALRALATDWGAVPRYLGCAPDDEETITDYFRRAKDADVVSPVGGASVGDFDFVKSAFRAAGGEIVFEKIAVKPGKPTWFGRLGNARVVGLPGNPASAIVTAVLFVRPLIERLAGRASPGMRTETAVLDGPVPENGPREAYLRATAAPRDDGRLGVAAAPNQDSSLLSPFAACNCLIKRLPNAPAEEVDAIVSIVRLRD
ncbi:MAG: gephyrin-like molybdotransferase Glp [Pseudomonadota bacterium]